MQRIRIASVSYLNALPFNWGLSQGRHKDLFDLILAPPHECSRLIQDAQVDVALIPSIELARIPGLLPVPGLGIASREEVRSVLLLSRVPLESVTSLAVDTNSRTSVALSSLILRRRHGCRPAMDPMPPDLGAMLAGHDAALLIGDAALEASHRQEQAGERPLHVLDLAREWNAMTGLPFVFALWACRPVVSPAWIGQILEECLGEGLDNLDPIASREERRTGLPARVIREYLGGSIHYTMSFQEAESLKTFYRMCREEELLDATAPILDLSPPAQTGAEARKSSAPRRRQTGGKRDTARAPRGLPPPDR